MLSLDTSLSLSVQMKMYTIHAMHTPLNTPLSHTRFLSHTFLMIMPSLLQMKMYTASSSLDNARSRQKELKDLKKRYVSSYSMGWSLIKKVPQFTIITYNPTSPQQPSTNNNPTTHNQQPITHPQPHNP